MWGRGEAGEVETFETSTQAEVLESPEEVTPSPTTPSNSAQPAQSDEMTLEDLAREARTISEGDPLTLFTKFVSHGQGYVCFSLNSPCGTSDIFLECYFDRLGADK